MLKIADSYFEKAQQATDKKTKTSNYQKACERYYMQTQLNPKNVYPYIQIGRIYTAEQKNKLAKEYFLTALGIEPENTLANYRFGDYYFARSNKRLALEYYSKAYNSGLKNDIELNKKMAEIYENFGDILKSNFYYKKAYMLQPENEELSDKIRDLESLKYKNTGYYSKKRK